jgi:hypothetical protein
MVAAKLTLSGNQLRLLRRMLRMVAATATPT